MGIFEVLAIGLAFWGVTNSAVIKRAYPEFCPPEPIMPAAVPDILPTASTALASTLFAWQLVSLTAMGTPFAHHSCPSSNPDDMTCFVSRSLSPGSKSSFTARLKAIELDPIIVSAIAEQREGCAANLDTFVAREAIAKTFNALVAASTTGKPKIKTETELSESMAKLFAWQLGGVLGDVKWLTAMCGANLPDLKAGLELVGMDVKAFTEVFCGIFVEPEGLPSPTVVKVKSQEVMDGVTDGVYA